MKNHIRVDGQLLQTNKKWSHLKQKQKEWILQLARQEYDSFVRGRGRLPVKGSKQQLIEHIYEIIREKGIWIPYMEIKNELDKRIARWNRMAEQNAVEQEAEKVIEPEQVSVD